MSALPLDLCWPLAQASAHALGTLRLGTHTRARQLAGNHGQRRAGIGQDFWQYRTVSPGDAASRIDWRRSGRADALFVRERELDRPAKLLLWIDDSPSMHYASNTKLMTKVEVATHLGLSLGIAALNSEETVIVPPGRRLQSANSLNRALAVQAIDAAAFMQAIQTEPGGDLVWISDFIGQDSLCAEVKSYAIRFGIRLHLLHVLDPAEVTFPFKGACHFEGLEGEEAFLSLEAAALKTAYLEALEALGQRLVSIAQASNGSYHRFVTCTKDQDGMLLATRPILQHLAHALASPL